MNANELAEIIEHLENARYIGASKAAEMLRQQQAEIVIIKKNTDYWADKNNWIRNNEPVAYVSTTGLNDIEWTDAIHSLNYGDALYTHPVKEITDEEIMDIWNSLFKDFSIDIGMFARAILRKAQER